VFSAFPGCSRGGPKLDDSQFKRDSYSWEDLLGGANSQRYKPEDDPDTTLEDADEETKDIDGVKMIQNDPLLLQFMGEGLAKDERHKKYFDNYSPKEEPFYAEYLRRLTNLSGPRISDGDCPDSELYVKLLQVQQANRRIYPNDSKVRASDRSVFFTGRYEEGAYTAFTSFYHCFMLRINYMGNVEYGSVMDMQTGGHFSECTALDISDDNKVAMVGFFEEGNPIKALIIYTDEFFLNQVIKEWSRSGTAPSNGYQAFGQDVAFTADGAIFVTGYYTGWSNGGYDCFVLKLDHLLNKVYAKGIGNTFNIYCNNIQVTNNFDYVYLGAWRTYDGTNNDLVFIKMDGYSQQVYYVQYIRADNAYDFELRRIFLRDMWDAFPTYDPVQAAANADTNNLLYICGSYFLNGFELLFFGYLDSTLTLQHLFYYGHPNVGSWDSNAEDPFQVSNNVVGDCAVTPDGRFMVATFATSTTRGAVNEIAWSFTRTIDKVSPNNCVLNIPDGFGGTYCTVNCCNYYNPAADYDNILSTADHTTMKNYCQQ